MRERKTWGVRESFEHVDVSTVELPYTIDGQTEYETMVFTKSGHNPDGMVERYVSRHDAERGHEDWCIRARTGSLNSRALNDEPDFDWHDDAAH